MQYVIEAHDLKKKFGMEWALNGINLRIPPSVLFGIIGADGAGKTTLLRILATLEKSDSGEVAILTHNAQTEYKIIRSQIGFMPQRFSLYEDLSVLENLLFFADIFSVLGGEREKRIKRLLQFSLLEPFKGRRAKNLSGGMKQKLALSCALIHTPKLLILDEPTTGVDPVSRKEFWTILRELKSEGISILVSTPYMDEAGYCEALIFMHKGKIILEGIPADLLKNYPVHLYEITGQNDAFLTYIPKEKLPESILLVYSSAGAIHAASVIPPASMNTVLENFKTVLPLARQIKKIDPEIEDLFFYSLFTLQSQADNNA
jgi:ABC-2 type transport system ATP-binding protein